MTVKLKEHLASIIDAGLQFRQAHWNVKGANFSGLHVLFGEAYDTLSEQADEVAERLSQKGVFVEGNVSFLVKTSFIGDLPKTENNTSLAKSGGELLRSLANYAQERFVDATNAGDHITADLLIGQAVALDTLAWKIRNHSIEGK